MEIKTISENIIQDNQVNYHIHNGIDSPKIINPMFNFSLKKVQKGITAAVGSTQATGVKIVADIVEISICANAGDSVTLPSAVQGMMIIITNHGAASCDVFPNVGDAINEAAVNTAKALAADATGLLYAWNKGKWEFLTLGR